MIKIVKTFICLVLFCFVTGFSDLKQNDEYSCGPVCAANCIINILNTNICEDELVNFLSKTCKTNNQGTSAESLCFAIENYLLKKHLKTDIKYFGIRKVEKKYKSNKPLNICEELQKGHSLILNIGFYTSQNESYKRVYGHYVNAYECRGSKILISDPYSKNSLRYISLKQIIDSKIINTKDNEKYSRHRFEYYEILPAFDYQKTNEKALLNGIISVYSYYL